MVKIKLREKNKQKTFSLMHLDSLFTSKYSQRISPDWSPPIISKTTKFFFSSLLFYV